MANEPTDPNRRVGVDFARDILLALFSGGLLLAATPPFNFWPAGLAALVVLHLTVRNASALRAAVVGWTCGFLVNAVGFGWGADLLRRFVHIGTAAGVGSVLGLAAYQAAVIGLWLGAAVLLHRRWGVSYLIAAPISVLVVESTVPFIFPWYLAIIATPAWPLLQIAELGGPPAVSALMVLMGVVIAEAIALWRARRNTQLAVSGAAREIRIGTIVVLAILAIGLGRAWHIAKIRRSSPHLRVAAVQPNFGIVSPQERTQRGEFYMSALRKSTEEASAQGADLIVWPESAFPFLFDRDLQREFAPGHPWELHPGHRGRLLFGALTHEFGTSLVQNSVVLATASGQIAGVYDKTHLLAFGEYIPFADRYPVWAKNMRARMEDWPDIIPGGGPKLLVDGNLRIAPLVCYEDLLPDYVHDMALLGPNLLVTSANHAWFGTSQAPRQAQKLAIMRGIETRRDMVRATTTGVSSISDGLGRVSVLSPLVDSGPDKPQNPQVIVGDVALVEAFALGPYSARWLPYGCLFALIVIVKRRKTGASGSLLTSLSLCGKGS